MAEAYISNTDLIAEELAASIGAVLPAGFSIRANNGTVEISSVSVPWRATSFVAQLASAAESARAGQQLAATNALTVVQDYVSEVTREPWPKAPDARQFTTPIVVIDGTLVRMAFGVGSASVLDLLPVQIRKTQFSGE